MTREEKELLYKDLCARLPYGVKVTFAGYSGRDDCTLNSQHLNSTYSIEYLKLKPYLRPMSSMTEEEEDELCKLCTLSDCNVNADWEFCGIEIIGSHPRYGTYFSTDYSAIEWLNKNMFDYRGLIPKGLALKATEGMYSN